jgi:hypothetical protein
VIKYNVAINIVTYSGVLFTMELYFIPKVNTLQLNTSATLRTHVQPVLSQNTHSYRILPTGPLVAIFQHSLPFLQSESFQTYVGTIHRRAIGPLAHHNGTSAYGPSVTCHLPAPTNECLHCPRCKVTCFSRFFPIRTQSSNHKGVP